MIVTGVLVVVIVLRTAQVPHVIQRCVMLTLTFTRKLVLSFSCLSFHHLII